MEVECTVRVSVGFVMDVASIDLLADIRRRGWWNANVATVMVLQEMVFARIATV